MIKSKMIRIKKYPKKYFALTIMLAINITVNAQFINRTGKDFYINGRLAYSMINDSDKFIEYNYKNLWHFDTIDYRFRWSENRACYIIHNQMEDTAFLFLEDIDNYKYDDYIFLTEKQFKSLSIKYPKSFKKIMNGDYNIGMNTEQIKIALGDPDDINSTEGSNYFHEQWVYDKKKIYIYFDNGKVTSIQR